MDPMSPNAFYIKRAQRYSLPPSILTQIRNAESSAASEEIVTVLLLSNQIRALCQKDNGRTRECKELKRKMINLNQFADKYSAKLCKISNDSELNKTMQSLYNSLLSAKVLMEDVLQIRFFWRNSKFGEALNKCVVDIDRKCTALEVIISEEDAHNVSLLSSAPKFQRVTKATRAERLCIEGHRAYFGHGRAKDLQAAFQHYQKAAELSSWAAMNHLAMMFEKGLACVPNTRTAIDYYESAIQGGNDTDAMHNLAGIYLTHPIHKNIEKSLELYQKAAKLCHVTSQIKLAELFERGIASYLEPDIANAIKCYRSAMKESLVAKNNLAVVLLHHFDDDGDKQFEEAVTLLHEAANLGCAQAQNNLGYIFEFGKGVEQNELLAMDWYTKAAAQEYNAAFVNLGYLQMKQGKHRDAYFNFIHASQHDTEMQSIIKSMVDSWYYLGIMYEKGYYVPRNFHAAFEHFRRASEVGEHELATLKIANCFFTGIEDDVFIPQNYEKAIEIYRQLAMNGNAIAANNLGIMYEEALGTSNDLEAAEMWYKLSAEKGNTDGIQNMKRLCAMEKV